MANELYQSRLTWRFGNGRVYQTFHWILNNLSGDDPYETANQINANLFAGVGWLFNLTGVMSSHCFLREFRTKRIDPPHTAAFYDVVPGGTIPGTLDGRIDEYFSTGWLKWHSASDRSGKHGLQIGPVPAGQFLNDDWYFVFRFRVSQFVVSALAPKTTSSGNSFIQALRFSDGTAEAVSAAQLAWPPGRVIKRRSKA